MCIITKSRAASVPGFTAILQNNGIRGVRRGVLGALGGVGADITGDH